MAEDLILRHSALASESPYFIEEIAQILTPALAVYPDIVDLNIATTIRLLGGDPNRWRPNIKTFKLGFLINRLIEKGVNNFKCVTTLELLTACRSGAADVLVAYPVLNANANRVREIAAANPGTRISVLVESDSNIPDWIGSQVGLFIDINPGMNYTGILQDRCEEIIKIATLIVQAGLDFRGLHYYDGHLSGYDLNEREQIAHRGYDRLMKLAEAIQQSGVFVKEVITASTPAFPYTLSYKGFSHSPFIHRTSSSTLIYSDCASLSQLPTEFGYRPAAIVVTTVVSRNSANSVICDAGSKTISVAAGMPTCAVLGRPEFIPLWPSAERLPIEVPPGIALPLIGGHLFLVPRSVSSTINNFDEAILVCHNKILRVERVTARGREAPLSIASLN